MHKYRFVELLCIILAVLFILSSQMADKPTDMTAQQLYASLEQAEENDLIERDKLFLKDKFAIELQASDSFVYYSSDDVMNVNEIFIGVVNDGDINEIKEKFENYLNEKYNLFNGYAPEQAAMLDAARVETVSNVIFFCVSSDADEIFSSLSALM